MRGFHPRAIDSVEPARRDVAEYLLSAGIRSGLVFPRTDEAPWRLHDYKNWCRRVWHPAVKLADGVPSRDDGAATSSGLPPYDLPHAFASLQIRAGLSIPEIAEQMGHSPQMTITTYAHVIRELKGLPSLSAEEQIDQAREARGRQVDVQAGV